MPSVTLGKVKMCLVRALTWNGDMINSCWNLVRSTLHISNHRYSIVRRRLRSVLHVITAAHSLHVKTVCTHTFNLYYPGRYTDKHAGGQLF